MALVLGVLLVLPSCGIPKLQQAEPARAAAGHLQRQSPAATTRRSSGGAEFFNDPHLTGLIDQALAGNQELKILNEDIRIANIEILARRGEYLPFVSFGSGAGLEKPSRFTPRRRRRGSTSSRPGQAFPEPLPDFLVATNVSWEIDIWRKLRNARDAASLRYLGTRRRAELRRHAPRRRGRRELLRAAGARQSAGDARSEPSRSRSKSLETAKAMKEAARDTELAVQRFQAEVRKNQSEKLIIQQEIVEVENRINFLARPLPAARRTQFRRISSICNCTR